MTHHDIQVHDIMKTLSIRLHIQLYLLLMNEFHINYTNFYEHPPNIDYTFHSALLLSLW